MSSSPPRKRFVIPRMSDISALASAATEAMRPPSSEELAAVQKASSSVNPPTQSMVSTTATTISTTPALAPPPGPGYKPSPQFTWATSTASKSNSLFGSAFAFATASASYSAPSAELPSSTPQSATTSTTGVAHLAVASSSALSSSAAAALPVSSSATVVTAVARKPPNPLAILASTRQRANPALKFVTQVPLEFVDIVPDFMLGEASCALFISLKYNQLHPSYLAGRCASVAKANCASHLRLLLVLVDMEDCQNAIEELTLFAVSNAWTIVLAWSNAEVARYLETYKSYEKKSADLLKEKLDSNAERFHDSLSQVRALNKTDINSLAQTFGSFASICTASAESLALIPGIGPKKVNFKFVCCSLFVPFLIAMI
jgi:DNA excision repair protein ERCC-1